MAVDKSEDTRYPYTYAADYIRSMAGYIQPGQTGGSKLSRADAANIKAQIAKVIGMPEKELAEKLANYYLENHEEITQNAADAFLATIIDRK